MKKKNQLKTQLVTLLMTKLQILAQILRITLDLTKQMTQVAQNPEILHLMRQVKTLQITQVTILVQDQMKQALTDVVCKKAT